MSPFISHESDSSLQFVRISYTASDNYLPMTDEHNENWNKELVTNT